MPAEPPAYAAASPYSTPAPQRPLWRRAGGAIAAAGFAIVKWGAVLLKLKVFTFAASMLVSVAAYAWLWGWKFAVGFVLLIFVHEMGHVIALQRMGIKASAPMFIPFFGAFVSMKEAPKSAWHEA